jgi:hypothetical protein
MWSNHPNPSEKSIRLDPGMEQCLDVFFIAQAEGQLVTTLVLVGYPPMPWMFSKAAERLSSMFQ